MTDRPASPRLTGPVTYLITRGNLTERNFESESKSLLAIVKAAIKLKVSFVQIREKLISVRLLSRLTAEVGALAAGTATQILVNDRFDVAVAAGANGVHLTSQSIPVERVRAVTPPGFVIGVSTHSISGALDAKNFGADFATFSPVFLTISKDSQLPATGIEELARVCEIVKPFPVIALGGVKLDNFPLALKAGASGIAGIGFFNDSANLAALERLLRAK